MNISLANTSIASFRGPFDCAADNKRLDVQNEIGVSKVNKNGGEAEIEKKDLTKLVKTLDKLESTEVGIMSKGKINSCWSSSINSC